MPTTSATWGSASEIEELAGAVAIAGVGEADHTQASGRSALAIAAQAVERALADAGLAPRDVDGILFSGGIGDAFDAKPFASTSARARRSGSRRAAAAWSWAATAPATAAGDAALGPGAPRAERLLRLVGDAAPADGGRPGSLPRRGALQGEPRAALRLVPAARLLRDHRAPTHDRVRHTGRSSSARSPSAAGATRISTPAP